MIALLKTEREMECKKLIGIVLEILFGGFTVKYVTIINSTTTVTWPETNDISED